MEYSVAVVLSVLVLAAAAEAAAVVDVEAVTAAGGKVHAVEFVGVASETVAAGCIAAAVAEAVATAAAAAETAVLAGNVDAVAVAADTAAALAADLAVVADAAVVVEEIDAAGSNNIATPGYILGCSAFAPTAHYLALNIEMSAKQQHEEQIVETRMQWQNSAAAHFA